MNAQSAPKGPKAQNLTTDVLIVGSGTGMGAALAAKELGLDVLIVEKTAVVGGSTARSGGAFWIPANPALLAGGSADTREQGEAYLDAIITDDVDRDRWQAFLDEARTP